MPEQWLRHREIVRFTLLAFISGLSVGPLRARPALVRDGVPTSQIVISAKPGRTVKLAATELQQYLARISGARVPIGSTPDARYPATIFVGASEHTDALGVDGRGLRHGAFRMVSGEDWLILLGNDDAFVPAEPWPHNRNDHKRVMDEWDTLTGEEFGNPVVGKYPLWKMRNAKVDLWQLDGIGSLNAVNNFLRDLGVRWYFPGKIGECVPERKTIELPDVNRTVKPDFALRDLHQGCKQFFGAGEDEIMWQLRLGLNMGYDLLGPKPHGHGMVPAHSRDGVRNTHPEYYALWGGRRMTNDEGKPCLSSPDLLKRHVNYIRNVFDVYGFPTLNISPADGYATLCQCHLCRNRGSPERAYHGKMSDYVWTYVNNVATAVLQTHPDRKVTALAYGTYLLPPANIEHLCANLVVILAPGRTTNSGASRVEFLRNYHAWLEKSINKEVYAWEYYLHARPQRTYDGVPVYFPHKIAKQLNWLQDVIGGEFVEVARYFDETTRHALASNHLNLYVTSRFYWNANLNVDGLLAEYCERFYGPAAKTMRTFIDYMEKNWRQATTDVTVLDRIQQLLTEARTAAGDTVYGKRVGLLLEYVKPLTQLREQIGKGRGDVPEARARERAAGEIILDGKLDEKAWGAMGFPLKDAQTGSSEVAGRTFFRVMWIGDSLYFGVLCREPDMTALRVGTKLNDDANIWRGDCIEIFLETHSHSYYHLTINPAGALFDLDRNDGFTVNWSSNAEVVILQGADFWSVEVRIPVAGEEQEQLDPLNGVAGRKPSETYPWYFNVCRQRKREEHTELSAFAPTGEGGFNQPRKFGRLYVK